MAQQTILSPVGLPGRPYGSFAAKRPSSSPSGHAGLFTRLGVTATPAIRYGSFAAKRPATPPSGHAGIFTRLGITATPAMRYGSFTGKREVGPAPVVEVGGGSVGPLGYTGRHQPGRERGWSARRDIDADEPVSLEQLLAEDEDLILMIAAAVHKRLI